MAFASLTAETTHFGAELPHMERYLPGLVDDELAVANEPETIFLDAAREALRVDLYEAWGYNLEDDDTTAFEERVTGSLTRLKFALAAKQLELMYMHFDQGEGSMDRDRYVLWRNRYLSKQQTFPSLGESHFGPTFQQIDVRL